MTEWDLGDCPYYRYWQGEIEQGFCQSGCHSEPSCITDEPEAGWPSRQSATLTPEEADAFARAARDRR